MKNKIKNRRIYGYIALLLVVCLCGFASCRSSKKVGCPSYGEHKQYFRERR